MPYGVCIRGVQCPAGCAVLRGGCSGVCNALWGCSSVCNALGGCSALQGGVEVVTSMSLMSPMSPQASSGCRASARATAPTGPGCTGAAAPGEKGRGDLGTCWRGDTGTRWQLSWCRLTALVLRVMALSRPYLLVDADGPSASLRWLLGQQRPGGAFVEHEPVIHREMQVGGRRLSRVPVPRPWVTSSCWDNAPL